MNVQFKAIGGEDYSVFWESREIGTVSLRHNKFHASTCHFHMNLSAYDVEFAREFGERLSAMAQKPLQIMLDSDEGEKIRFLEAAGFRCKRKCYEAEVTAKDLTLKIPSDFPIRQCHAGEPAYLACTQLLYRYYQDTHNHVSPLTASFYEFSEQVPKTAYYVQETEVIKQAIFVEDGELAYCCSADIKEFENFAAAVVGEMFSRYSSVSFEADDCDPAARTLLAMFQIDLQTSYDTYIREENGSSDSFRTIMHV